jgi:hypothetical protein
MVMPFCYDGINDMFEKNPWNFDQFAKVRNSLAIILLSEMYWFRETELKRCDKNRKYGNV